MAKLTIHAGDWPAGAGSLTGDLFVLPKKPNATFSLESVQLRELSSVEVASEDSVRRAGGTIGWGAAGAVLLGPVGLLAGLLAGGRGKDVTFVATFKDGRRLMATTDSKAFTKLRAATF